MAYLATHPRRGFRPGDEVIHVGEGVSYRGRLGRVMSVHGSKSSGHIKVLWDHKMTAMEYSIGWALVNLGVHINCLRQQYHDFDGRKYASKYMHYGFSGGDVIKGFTMVPHGRMKKETEEKLELGKLLTALDYELLQFPPNIGPGVYTLVPHENGMGFRIMAQKPEPKLAPKPAEQVAEPKAEPKAQEPRKDVTFPAIVENREDGTITHVGSEAMLQELGEGDYIVYSKVGELRVRPIAKKEVIFL